MGRVQSDDGTGDNGEGGDQNTQTPPQVPPQPPPRVPPGGDGD